MVVGRNEARRRELERAASLLLCRKKGGGAATLPKREPLSCASTRGVAYINGCPAQLDSGEKAGFELVLEDGLSVSAAIRLTREFPLLRLVLSLSGSSHTSFVLI